jgi:hypothetical protein
MVPRLLKTTFFIYWQEGVAETSKFVNTQQFWLKSDNTHFYAYQVDIQIIIIVKHGFNRSKEVNKICIFKSKCFL